MMIQLNKRKRTQKFFNRGGDDSKICPKIKHTVCKDENGNTVSQKQLYKMGSIF